MPREVYLCLFMSIFVCLPPPLALYVAPLNPEVNREGVEMELFTPAAARKAKLIPEALASATCACRAGEAQGHDGLWRLPRLRPLGRGHSAPRHLRLPILSGT